MRLAVILFNLGGPDRLENVEVFLRNLFSDPAIIALPRIFRIPLARYIASRRAPLAREIYAHMGGRSPILDQTLAQSHALECALNDTASDKTASQAKVFVAMRCFRPFSDDVVPAVKAFAPDRIVLLPLYPQYSTTTTSSSFKDWQRAAKAGLSRISTSRICCYPDDPGFIRAVCAKILKAMAGARADLSYRLLLSAHGLPKRVISRGDPYQWQVERTGEAIVAGLGIKGLEVQICYQSRVGPLAWIGPATDCEIRRAGKEGKALIVAPIAFVSEHSETLVELDIEYAKLARESGVPDYRRAETVGTHPDFIAGLAALVRRAGEGQLTMSAHTQRICPPAYRCCGLGIEA